MDRCFWEERLLGVSGYKNDELLTPFSNSDGGTTFRSIICILERYKW
jgi:hypothetical protein